MNLTVETITALRAQGVPAEAVLDAIQTALTKRVEADRERARERQQRSRARRRASAPGCHSDIRAPSLPPLVPPGQKEKNQKKKPNPPIIPPEPSLSLSPGEPELTTTTYMPSDWTFREEHIHAAQAGCEAKGHRMMVEKVKDNQPGFLREFAEQYVAEQAIVFRRWAQGWRRGAVDWDDQFHEWLRVGFAKMGKHGCPSLTHEGQVLTLTDMLTSFYFAKREAEDRESERMDPNFESKQAQAAREASERAENERRYNLSNEERWAEQAAEKRRADMKWWADRAEGFRKTLSPEKFDEWLRNMPMPDMLPDWCGEKLTR